MILANLALAALEETQSGIAGLPSEHTYDEEVDCSAGMKIVARSTTSMPKNEWQVQHD
jgi:hypothetical protein